MALAQKINLRSNFNPIKQRVYFTQIKRLHADRPKCMVKINTEQKNKWPISNIKVLWTFGLSSICRNIFSVINDLHLGIYNIVLWPFVANRGQVEEFEKFSLDVWTWSFLEGISPLIQTSSRKLHGQLPKLNFLSLSMTWMTANLLRYVEDFSVSVMLVYKGRISWSENLIPMSLFI